MPGVENVTVTRSEAGQKLLQFLMRRLGKGIPRPALMRWIRTGQVRIDGGRAKPFDRLEEGQSVRIPPHEPAAFDSSPEPPGSPAPKELEVIHEDDEIIVVNKPSGLPSQPGSRHGDSVQSRLAALWPDADFKPQLAHRLDRDTSGVMVAGLTFEALRRLTELFRERETGKVYLAWVKGSWPHEGPKILEDRLAKVRRGRHERIETGAGKAALCRVTPVRAMAGASLLQIELMTGLTHQIRVQLASRGHPVVGDKKYGQPPHATPMLLHAARLTLPMGQFERLPDWPEKWKVTPEDLPNPQAKPPKSFGDS